MKNIKDILTEKLFETDNWLYVFIPNKYVESMEFYLGNSHVAPKIEYDYSKYVKVKTKKNISDDKSLVERAWSKKYPDDKVPGGFTLIINSLGDPEIEKLINKLLKMIDSGKITMLDFEKERAKYKDIRLNENPEKFKEILDALKK